MTSDNLTKKGEDKRYQILQAAVEKFIEHDFYNVKMEQIADRAGVGKGTIYEYFTSKEDLFKESFTYWIEKYELIFLENYVQTKSVKDNLHHIMKIHLRFFRENSHWVRLLFNERPSFMRELDELLLERRKLQLQGIEALLLFGVESGEVRPNINAELTARIFFNLSFTVIGGMLLLDELEPDNEKADYIFDFFWRGVANNHENQ